MKNFIVFLVLVIFVSCVESVSSQQTKPLPDKSFDFSVPKDWILYPSQEISDSVLQCASRSLREWKVEQAENKVKIALDRRQNHQAALPAAIRSQTAKFQPKGSRSVLRVADGWLVGNDAGEFGGGLWWFSSDGKINKRLAGGNIVGFAETSIGVLALTGLAHMSFDDGKVLKIVGDAGINRKVETLVELGSAPRTFVVESSESLLVLTGDSLVRVKTSGSNEKLFSTRYNYLYPNSMIVSPSGVILVGMRHFITRLTPTSGGYQEEWFVPNNCTRFEERGLDCVSACQKQKDDR